jgi:hypothetical protein
MQDDSFGHESSVAVQVDNEARNLSWCRNLMACRCGCPGVSALHICLGAGTVCKNRDNLSRVAGNKLPILAVLGTAEMLKDQLISACISVLRGGILFFIICHTSSAYITK